MEPIVAIAIFAAVSAFPAAAVGYLVYQSLDRSLERQRERFTTWIPWAAHRELTCLLGDQPSDRPVIRGVHQGVELLIRTYPEGQTQQNRIQTHIRARIPDQLAVGLRIETRRRSGLGRIIEPPEIETGHATIDRECRIFCADEAAATAILTGREVEDRLMDLLDDTAHLHLDGAWLASRHPSIAPTEFGARVDRVIALARALAAGPRRAILGLAEARDLEFTETSDRLVARATYRSYPLTVRFERPRGEPLLHTTIEVGLPTTLPPHLTIQRIGPVAPDDRLELGDPILDTTVAVTGDDPRAIGGLLRGDELRGDLLEVVHGHEGSCVRDNKVVLTVPGLAIDTLEGLVEDAVTLARGLDRRARGPAVEPD